MYAKIKRAFLLGEVPDHALSAGMANPASDHIRCKSCRTLRIRYYLTRAVPCICSMRISSVLQFRHRTGLPMPRDAVQEHRKRSSPTHDCKCNVFRGHWLDAWQYTWHHCISCNGACQLVRWQSKSTLADGRMVTIHVRAAVKSEVLLALEA